MESCREIVGVMQVGDSWTVSGKMVGDSWPVSGNMVG
jgi:hypothetical protein